MSFFLPTLMSEMTVMIPRDRYSIYMHRKNLFMKCSDSLIVRFDLRTHWRWGTFVQFSKIIRRGIIGQIKLFMFQ
jgi:hypothetical protein